MKRKHQWLVIIAMMMCGHMSAQEKTEVTLSADLVSQYVWRGLELGSASVQPTFGVAWKGLSLSAFGSIGFVDTSDPREIDLIGSYTIGGLSVGVIDYWINDPVKQYFRYKAHQTSHVFEGFVGYDFGPVNFSWQTIFAGNDGLNKSGHRAYSSYFELAAPFSLATCDWRASLGVVPYATDYYEVSNFAAVDVSLRATKAIRFTDSFALPLFAQISVNPDSRHAYFVFGLTLNAFQ
ncbi:MAG: hypothetical protein J5661_01195 [Bacteroidaceae bacterium]|nr:hypothetical protein [Bacteroidaceae bacterium]